MGGGAGGQQAPVAGQEPDLGPHLHRGFGVGDVDDQVVAAGTQHLDARIHRLDGVRGGVLAAEVADGVQSQPPVGEVRGVAEGILSGPADRNRRFAL